MKRLSPLALLALGGCLSFDDARATAGYFDFDGAARACARITSCPGLAASLRQSIFAPLDGDDFSACMTWLAGPTPTPAGGFDAQIDVLSRVASAPSCDAALADLPVRVLPDDDARCASGLDACTPEGDLLDCHGRRVVRCGEGGFMPGMCFVNADGIGRCAVGACIFGAFGLPSCDGASLAVCEEGIGLKQMVDCGAIGASCVTTPNEVSWNAVYDAKASVCTSPDNPSPVALCRDAPHDGFTTCTPDGAAVVVCGHVAAVRRLVIGAIEIADVEALYDCRKDLDFRCAEGPIASCVRSDAECATTDADVNRCDGDTIDLCIAGRRERVDCAPLGARCVEEGGRGRCAIGG